MKEEQRNKKPELERVYANSFSVEATIYDIQVNFLLGGEGVTVVMPPPLAAQVAESLRQVAAAYHQKFGMPRTKSAPEAVEGTVPVVNGSDAPLAAAPPTTED